MVSSPTSADAVDQLAGAVGDPGTVVDNNGRLPAGRRELALSYFKARYVTKVRELRASVAARQGELKQTKGRSEGAPIREALREGTHRLAFLEETRERWRTGGRRVNYHERV